MLVFTLGTFVTLFAALGGFRALRYQLDDLYNYTLVPISAINKADASLADLVRYAELMRVPNASPGQRTAYSGLAKGADAAGSEVIEAYKKSWRSTQRPGFSEVLRGGSAGLQDQEAQTLKALDTAYAGASKSLGGFLASVEAGAPNQALGQATVEQYLRVRGFLHDLITVNDQFAKLSDEVAQAAFAQTSRAIWIAAAAALLVGLLLAWAVTRLTTQRLSRLEEGAQSLRRGDLDFRVEVPGRDEIGTVAQTFNTSVAQLKTLQAQQEQERQRGRELQENVARFQDIASEIASGDLTRRGEVTQDALGNVVDAVNLTVEEIARLLAQVQQAAQEMDSGANRMTQTNRAILQGAQAQAEIAQQTNDQTTQVAGSIRELTQNVISSAEAARQTLSASSQSQEALQNTLTGMQNIRREVQSISRNIKGLSERSSEISEVVDTIDGIAKQTHLLALNAALEAAGAGEAGARFGVVAQQVRKLAESTAKSTGRVTNLVKGIQTEIQGLVLSVEGSSKEVEQGYQVAGEAASRLQEIAEFANQSARLAEMIASAAQEQVHGIEQVNQSVQTIAGTASRAEEQSQKGQEAAEALRQLSEQLTQSLSRFRLPA